MQMEMEAGGLLFFDLFVAMCNHMVRLRLLFLSLLFSLKSMTLQLHPRISSMTILPVFMHEHHHRASQDHTHHPLSFYSLTPTLLPTFRTTSQASPNRHVHLASPSFRYATHTTHPLSTPFISSHLIYSLIPLAIYNSSQSLPSLCHLAFSEGFVHLCISIYSQG